MAEASFSAYLLPQKMLKTAEKVHFLTKKSATNFGRAFFWPISTLDKQNVIISPVWGTFLKKVLKTGEMLINLINFSKTSPKLGKC